MKEIPILFSTDMVQAILEGRKTMTRRIIKPQPVSNGSDRFNFNGKNNLRCHNCNDEALKWFLIETETSPYGQPGDILWVRETFGGYMVSRDGKRDPIFKAGTHLIYPPSGKWKPGIHMPKEAARIYLQVEAVKVERLQDITAEDAISEGIEVALSPRPKGLPPLVIHKDYVLNKHLFMGPIASFETLWRSINGVYSWEQNPWVWLISFKVLSTTGRPDFLPSLTTSN